MVDNPPDIHARPAVIFDIQIHQYVSEYLSGNKKALKKTLDTLKKLEQSNEKNISRFNYDVWLSGAHMRIAHMLAKQDLKIAKKHLQKAKSIIQKNRHLKLRLNQWKRLNAEII